MERRVFIAVLLSFAVLYTFQTYFAPAPEEPAAAPSASAKASPSVAPSSEDKQQSTPSAGATEASPAREVAAVVGDAQERQITVESTTVRAVFTNRGGRLLHWQLKNYHDEKGEPVDLVPSNLPPDQYVPFSLSVDNPQQSQRLNTALYRVSGDRNGRLDVTENSAPLVFEYEGASGLAVRKEFRFEPHRYLVTLQASVRQGSQVLLPTVIWGPGLGDHGAAAGGGSFFTGNSVQPPRAIFQRDGKVTRLTPDAAIKTPTAEGTFGFAGVDDHYFLATVVGSVQGRVEYRPVTLPGSGGTADRRLISHSIRLATPGQSLKYFAGPKQFDELQAMGPDFVRAIDFGIFAWLVVPLLGTLKWLFRFTGNYGWSIILLTIIINLVMFPLRHKSNVAMRKMQAIQPQMKAIQDRYSHLKMTDPGRQKMNEEVTALYRDKGVNPASGCLPLLLTMPVLLAFYALLSQTIELRGAPFVGWIRDLSAADPYFVLPAIMGVSMFWQQKVTPTSVDPAQQKVMMIMPVMFTAMMLFSASGVVLYWFVSQVWAIGQMYFTNWLIGPAPISGRQQAVRRS